MFDLRLDITESKFFFYENNVFIFNSALFNKLQINCYLHCKSTNVKALQLFNACHKDKHYKTKKFLRYENSGDKLHLLSFFNSALNL